MAPGTQRHAPGRPGFGRPPAPAAAGLGAAAGVCSGPGVLAAVAGIAVLAAACGGSSPTTAGQMGHQRQLAYAHCMRAHGVPGFPGLQGFQGSGTVSGTGQSGAGAIGSAQFGPALRACAHLALPGTAAQQPQRDIRQALKFAACMRAHGITNFPDPPAGGGTPRRFPAPTPTRRSSGPRSKPAGSSSPAVDREPHCFCWPDGCSAGWVIETRDLAASGRGGWWAAGFVPRHKASIQPFRPATRPGSHGSSWPVQGGRIPRPGAATTQR